MKKLSIFNFQFSTRKGFTLIELLVVIGIISILIAFLMANFVGVRQRGRDGQRKSDLRQIQTALELYRSDNGVYPLTAAFPACGSSLMGTGATPPTYMKKIPCDPTSAGSYSYTSDGNTYTLYACLENANDKEKDSTKVASCTAASYTLNQP